MTLKSFELNLRLVNTPELALNKHGQKCAYFLSLIFFPSKLTPCSSPAVNWAKAFA